MRLSIEDLLIPHYFATYCLRGYQAIHPVHVHLFMAFHPAQRQAWLEEVQEMLCIFPPA
jgi:hypothetical protein